jgi:ChrR Cupin-like domain
MKQKNTPNSPLQLDADIAAAITAAHNSDAAPDALVRNVRSSLMKRIATDVTSQHHTVHADDDSWVPFLPKIDCKILNEIGGITSYLLRMKPGAVLPPHRHPVDEECVVIEGVLRIGNELVLSAGGFHLGRKDTPHDAITTDTGALIFLRGAHPEPELVL